MRIEEVVFEDGGKTIEHYDDYDRVVRKIDYDLNGEFLNDAWYEYFGDGENCSVIVKDAEGKQLKKIEYNYLEDGSEESKQYGKDNVLELRILLFFTEDGIKEIIYDKDGNAKDISIVSFS